MGNGGLLVRIALCLGLKDSKGRLDRRGAVSPVLRAHRGPKVSLAARALLAGLHPRKS